MQPKYKQVLSNRFDLTGNSLIRQFRHWVRMKTSIMGNFDTGPGLICMLKLGVLHYLGKPIFKARIWLRNQYALKAKMRHLLARFK